MFVPPVRKRFVEKIRSSKSIVPVIQIFPVNAVINLIALRVGETEGNLDRELIKKFLLLFFSTDSKQCHHEKKIYSENETWAIDHCTNCTCRSGLVSCTMVQCPTYSHCGYMYKPENECCPKCGGK